MKFNNSKNLKVLVLKSPNTIPIENKNIDVIYTDSISDSLIIKLDPDLIVTSTEGAWNTQELQNANINIKRKWLSTKEPINNISETIICNALRSSCCKLISNFSVAESQDQILETYKSLAAQDYINWEWVVVINSTNVGISRLLTTLSSIDSRVRVINPHRNLRDGEAKHLAAFGCDGELLVDLLVGSKLNPDAFNVVLEAFNQDPDCGFLCSNSKEYKDLMELSDPNHFCVWTYDTYHRLRGHNKLLRSCSSYELALRTSFNTEFICLSDSIGSIQIQEQSSKDSIAILENYYIN